MLAFILVSPATIWIAEFIHEVLGHCLTIYILGSRVKVLFISPLAPYIPSRLIWEIEGAPLSHNVIIASSGIVVSLIVFVIIQRYLSTRKTTFLPKIILFWLSFWIFINTTSYLIMGLILPYGDIEVLMNLGVLDKLHLVLFLVLLIPPGLNLVTKRLGSILSLFFKPGQVDSAISTFWIILPMPLILAELVRASWTPTPLIGGSFLILLIPVTYMTTSWGVIHLSRYDPRDQLVSLNNYNGAR